MKFTRVIGKIEPKLIAEAEKMLSMLFTELSVNYDNRTTGSKIGGDPFIFGLLYPVEHVATLAIKTAATDGKRFYWNPKYILKFKNKLIGLRILAFHEASHVTFMHPSRRGTKIPRLWNIVVDYIANNFSIEDLRLRKLYNHPSAEILFKENLGEYITFKEYADTLKQKVLDIVIDENGIVKDIKMPGPNEDIDLSPEQKAELDKKEKCVKKYYADPSLTKEQLRPEKLYDQLYELLPKCESCGCVGRYKTKTPMKVAHPCKHSCKTCENCYDIFSHGDTLDDHFEFDISDDDMYKRIVYAKDMAGKMAGKIPAGMEEEISNLTKPVIRWEDAINMKISRTRNEAIKNDWSRLRTRPLFYGMVLPKKNSKFIKFGVLIDTSGSMTKEYLSLGISQLQNLDTKFEGTLVSCDTQCYWDKASVLKKFDLKELEKIKIVGRGGTVLSDYFAEYEDKIGKCDFHIVITDGHLFEEDLKKMKHPGTDVFWLIVGENFSFNPSFGRIFNLDNSRR